MGAGFYSKIGFFFQKIRDSLTVYKKERTDHLRVGIGKPYINEGILPNAAGPYFFEEIFIFTVKSPLHLNVRE
jgi:hypothetical protein